MRTAPLERGPERGFTLLEVLAAVAVLGVLYTVLAGAAMDGLRHEGDAERRLRASLLADNVLAELEQAFATGAAPPVGQSEDERDEFTIEVDVRPFDLAGILAALPGAPEPDPDQLPAVLLLPPGRGNPPLVEVEVVVHWTEGAHEQSIQRLTHGFDLSVAAPALETLTPAEGQGQAPTEEQTP